MNNTKSELPSCGDAFSLTPATSLSRIKFYLADAAAYWEPMRVVYNVVLGVLAVACWGLDIVLSGPSQWLGAVVVMAIFAGIANALYCLAYPVDLAFQMVPLSQNSKGFRSILFTVGVVIASGLALWVMLGNGGMG